MLIKKKGSDLVDKKRLKDIKVIRYAINNIFKQKERFALEENNPYRTMSEILHHLIYGLIMIK